MGMAKDSKMMYIPAHKRWIFEMFTLDELEAFIEGSANLIPQCSLSSKGREYLQDPRNALFNTSLSKCDIPKFKYKVSD